MTISSTNRVAGPFSGTGLQTTFGFTFKVFQTSDVLVVLTNTTTGAAVDQTLGSQYAVTLNSDQDSSPGGTVTMVTAPLSGYTLTISSQVQALQSANLANAGNFYPLTINNALDLLTILIQQLDTVAGNSIQIPLQDTGLTTVLPAAAQRANNLLGFDSSGNAIAAAPVSGTATALQALLGNPANGSGADLVGGVGRVVNTVAAVRALSKTGVGRAFVLGYYSPGDDGGGQYWCDASDTTSADNGGTIIVASDGGRWHLIGQDSISVRQFGAYLDGTHDDTAAINAALASGYYDVFHPAGIAKTSAVINVPAGVNYHGSGNLSRIYAYGCNGVSLNGSSASVGNMMMESYSSAGSADPRTYTAITVAGTSSASLSGCNTSNLYLQGWNICEYLSYALNGSHIGIITINANYGVTLFGKCVGNMHANCQLNVNGGQASYNTLLDGGTNCEGNLIINSSLTSGEYGFASQGFLSQGIYNCVIDLIGDYGIYVDGYSQGLIVNCPWIYSTNACINFTALGAANATNAQITVAMMTSAGADNGIYVGANQNNVNISGGTLIKGASGGYGVVFGATGSIIGTSIVNQGSAPDVFVNASPVKVDLAQYTNVPQYETTQVPTIASAATLTIPNNVPVANVSGTTGITSITATGWEGQTVVLIFAGILTVTSGSNLHLNGNYSTSANSTLTLVCSNGYWYEVARA